MDTFTYENQGENTILVYTLDADEQIDTLEINMTANNRIEGALSPAFLQKNTARKLKYNISSKISLKQYFANTVNKETLILVLKSLTETMLLVEKYLLEEESFLMDMDYIYVDRKNSKAYLLCFPIINEREKHIKFSEFIRKMIFQLKFDETENCSYVAMLMNYVNQQESFTLRGFLKILTQIETEEKQEKGTKEETPETGYLHERPEPETGYLYENQVMANGGGQMEPPYGVSGLPMEQGQAEAKEEKKKRFLFSLGKKKEEKPKKEKKKEQIKPKKKKKEKKGADQSPVAFPVPGRDAAFPAPNERREKGDENSTSLLVSNQTERDASHIGRGRTGKNKKIMITRLRDGQKMQIQKEVFRIGKSRDNVDFYVADNNTVSRNHAEISVTSHGIYIKDNNSLNHTYVNEQMAPAGMPFLLKDGDVICLSDERFSISIRP